MNRARELALARRQQRLIFRSAELRHRWAGAATPFRVPLATADRVVDAGRWVQAHPEALLAGAVVLVLLRPRRALRWGFRLWSGWRLWQRVQRMLHRL
jgi:hypothetical protein